MKKISLSLIVLFAFSVLLFSNTKVSVPQFKEISLSKFDTSILKEGDVIFQTDNHGQSLAVQKATLSKYSHVGILFLENNEWFVYEAIQPVIKSKLASFIRRGDKGNFTISRYKNAIEELTASKISKMKTFFTKVEGKDYDLLFEWSDKTWYCSELVWKMYHSVGIQISEFEKFGQYNLEDPYVQQIIKQRFKNGVNKNETVITPKGIYESALMEEIYTNY